MPTRPKKSKTAEVVDLANQVEPHFEEENQTVLLYKLSMIAACASVDLITDMFGVVVNVMYLKIAQWSQLPPDKVPSLMRDVFEEALKIAMELEEKRRGAQPPPETPASCGL